MHFPRSAQLHMLILTDRMALSGGAAPGTSVDMLVRHRLCIIVCGYVLAWVSERELKVTGNAVGRD